MSKESTNRPFLTNTGHGIAPWLKASIESAFRCRIYRGSIPHGADLFVDLDQSFGIGNFRTVFDIGMGKAAGTLPIYVNPNSKRNSLHHAYPESQQASVEIDTVTGFCAKNGIDRIDFMKIDTEGYELEVLEGSRELFQSQGVKVVYAECGAKLKNELFVSFWDLSNFLEQFGYELFGIYDQQPHWLEKRSLIYFNPAFICPDFVKRP